MEPDTVYTFEIVKTEPDGKLKILSLVGNRSVDIQLSDSSFFSKVYISPYNENQILVGGKAIPVDEIIYIKGKTKRSRAQDVAGAALVAGGIIATTILIALLVPLLFLAVFLAIFGLDLEIDGGFAFIPLILLVFGIPLFFSKKRFFKKAGYRFRIRKTIVDNA